MAGRKGPDSFERVWPSISSIQGWLAKEEAAALHAAARAVPPGRWIVEIGSHRGRSTAALATGKRPGVRLLAIDSFGGRHSRRTPPRDMRAFCDNMDRLGVGPDLQLFWGTSAEAARRRESVFRVARERAQGAGEDAGAGATAGGQACLFPAAGDDAEPCRRRVVRIEGEADPAIGLLFVNGAHDRASVLLDIDLWEPLIAERGAVCFHDAFFRRGVTEALFRRHLLNAEFRYIGSVVNTTVFRREGRLSKGAMLWSALRMTARLGHFARNVATAVGVRRRWRWLQRRLPPSPDFEY
jgi:Methyltransferase domain